MTEVLKAGARGYVLKSDAANSLVAAVEALEQHKPFFTPDVSEIVLKAFRDPAAPEDQGGGLTPREREAIQLVAEGKSNKEVATALGISVKTAETHRANVISKLSLNSVSELVRYAIRNKIIEP